MAPIGPSLPTATVSTAGPQLPTAGPQLPPGPAKHDDDGDDDDDSDDDFGPALPPDLVQARQSNPHKQPVAGPSFPPTASSSRAVQGPALPPGFAPPPRDESDDDDDDFGPMPLPAGVSIDDNDGARQFREREEREREKRRREAEGDGKPKREEWMLVPPKEMDLMSSIDTTKLKGRGFQQNTKPGSSKSSASSGPNLWTETPQERQQRLQDEMLGVKRKVNQRGDEEDDEETDERRRKRERDWKLRQEVDKYNKSSRNTSLLDSHTASSKSGKDKNKEPAAIWDRERDMGVGGRLMDEGKRADIVKSAKELGGRFGGGGYL
ncbi:hypothetical protein T439DRAFT_376450 [Meredithblackwellia eburnea MCA 4105]